MKFSIVKRYKIFFAITITFLIIGIGSMLFKGFNLGIDFTGGSIMDLEGRAHSYRRYQRRAASAGNDRPEEQGW